MAPASRAPYAQSMALPIELSVHPLRSVLPPGSEPRVEHVLIRLRVGEVQGRTRPRLSAVLVLDVSGSMQGEPLAHVIRSAERLCDLLGDDDSLGVVAFAGAAHIVADVQRLDAEARRALKAALARLHADSSTNISDGMAHALVLAPVRAADERLIALLMSDGQPNVGTATPDGLAREAALIKSKGMAISTLGFGAHHDENVMVAIADAGGGRYAFINDPHMADASFARALGAQRDVVGEELRLVLAPAAGVDVVRVLGGPKLSFGADGVRVHLPDAIAGDELNAIVELQYATPHEAGPWRPLRVALEGRAVGASSGETIRGEVAVTVTRLGPYDADVDVGAHVAIALAGEARDQARGLADRGNFAGAAEVLRGARAAIEQAPGFADGPDAVREALRDAFEVLVDDITAMDNRPDPEAYAQYRKAQFDYTAFAAGGTKGRQGTPLMASPGAEALARLVHSGPLPPAHFVVIVDGQRSGVIELSRPEMIVGRTGDNQIVVAGSGASRRHTRIQFHDGAYWAIDLGSTNGTLINGERIRVRHRLRHGDVIEYGDYRLEYSDGPADGSPAPAA